MAKPILIVQGHPDCARQHLCHALAQAYADGAAAAGHAVETVEPARLGFPLLTSPADWQDGPPPPQLARPGFAIDPHARNPLKAGLLRGRSARLVVSMGMPAPFYRWFYGAYSVKLMRRNILGFAGVAPVRTTIVGNAGAMPAAQVERWCERLRRLGGTGA